MELIGAKFLLAKGRCAEIPDVRRQRLTSHEYVIWLGVPVEHMLTRAGPKSLRHVIHDGARRAPIDTHVIAAMRKRTIEHLEGEFRC